MKKNFFFGLFAAAGMLLATSCSNDELEVVQSGDEAQVTFSLAAEGTLGSRAISDGKTANQLVYAVFNSAGDKLSVFKDADNDGQNDIQKTDDINDLTQNAHNVTITLAKGQTYKVAFWAQNKECSAYDTSNLPNVTINYANSKNNDELRDAFFKTVEFTVSGNKTIDVVLKRPFAQINVGVEQTDWDAAVASGIEIEQSSVVIKNAANKINLLTGEVEGSEEVTYNLAAIPAETLEVETDNTTEGKEQYKWLSMSYILVADDNKTDIDEDGTLGDANATLENLQFTFKPESGNPIVFAEGLNSVPVQRNWRTNILGKILTGDIQFNITIDPIYEDDNNVIKDWANGWSYDEETNTYTVWSAEGLKTVAEEIGKVSGGFDGTIKLDGDIDLTGIKTMDDSFAPLGSTGERDSNNRLICEPFKGTLDGNGHAIKNLNQSGWDMGYEWGKYGSLGLFAKLESATVKNLVLEGFDAAVEGGDIAFVAGSATGTCTFENIEIKSGGIGTYNNGIGSIIGWSGDGVYTFKNIKIGSDVILGGLWGSFDSSVGGIVGQAEPGAKYHFENVEIDCRLDVFNDCTASYDYYNYRMSGMIIGRCEETTTIDGKNYPDLSKYNITCTNVVVNYGDWMNYHYCEPTPGYNNGRGMRVESGYAYDGLPADYDHSQCVDNHMNCIPFDQLFGGAQLGVKGIKEYSGVTVNYPYTFNQTEAASADAVKTALEAGGNVKLTADVNVGTTQLSLADGQKIDLNGHTLTTENVYGGISMKNGASIKNGTIKHTGNTAAIKAWNVGSIENVIINVTPTDGKVKGGIVIQSGADSQIASIKDVTITGVTNGIETYQCGWTDDTPAIGYMENVTIDATDTGILLSAHIGKAKNCNIKGANYGINMHLKGEYKVGVELENCTVTGTTASIWGHDEKGISNTNNCSLTLTYDAATTLNGSFVWDFEDECKSVVTLNKPE